jgi:hypothetical protein
MVAQGRTSTLAHASQARAAEAINVDVAAEAFSRLAADVQNRMDSILSEADARLQLINRILVDVLGWDWNEIATEPRTDAGYVDYLLRQGGANVLVVEAKRTEQDLIASAVNHFSAFKLRGPALRPAQAGIQQAAQYCLQTGVPYTVLTRIIHERPKVPIFGTQVMVAPAARVVGAWR